MNVKMTILGQRHSPPCKGGVDATSKKYREASFVGADGVVAHKSCVSDHPVRAASVASQLFLNGAATPPLQGGEYARTTLLVHF